MQKNMETDVIINMEKLWNTLENCLANLAD